MSLGLALYDLGKTPGVRHYQQVGQSFADRRIVLIKIGRHIGELLTFCGFGGKSQAHSHLIHGFERLSDLRLSQSSKPRAVDRRPAVKLRRAFSRARGPIVVGLGTRQCGLLVSSAATFSRKRAI